MISSLEGKPGYVQYAVYLLFLIQTKAITLPVFFCVCVLVDVLSWQPDHVMLVR